MRFIVDSWRGGIAGSVLVLLGGCGQQAGHSTVIAKNAKPAASAIAATITSGNGPFGIDLSADPKALGADPLTGATDKGLFELKAVPKPLSDFKNYFLVAFPGVPVCEIRASTDAIDGDSLGVKARSIMDDLAVVLSEKYGKPDKTDSCGGSDVSCESQFWTMSIQHGERVYSYEWHPQPTPASPIRSVALWVRASEYGNPIVRLDYEVNDAATCGKAERSAKASSL